MTVVLGFTRPSKRLKDSVKEAEDMGFTVMAAPSLEILPGEDAEFTKLEASVTPESIVVFCSSTAVEECQTRFGDKLADVIGSAKVVSIGPATTKRLEAAGLRASAVPEDYSSEGIVDMMRSEVGGKRVILVRSDSGSDVLSDGMNAAGAELVDVSAYRLKEAGMGNALLHMFMTLKKGRIDVLAFTSPMSASMFISMAEKQFGKEKADDLIRKTKIAAIGGPTKKRLTELGFAPDIVPEKTTFTDMLKAIRAEFPE